MMRALGRIFDMLLGFAWLAAFVVFCATDWTPDRFTIGGALGLVALGSFRDAVRG